MPRRPDVVPPDPSTSNTTYATDLTAPQWQLIEPLLPPPDTSGAPHTTNLRHALNAMLYRTETGCQWKMLLRDFGVPWKTVYHWHETFARLGTWERVQQVLAARVRVGDGREPHPSLLSLDSQTVKSAETVPDAGFDGCKRMKRRMRHVLVDTLGRVLAVAVTSAAVSDAKGAEGVRRAVEGNRRLANSAYHRDTLYEHLAATKAGYRLHIVAKLEGSRGSSRTQAVAGGAVLLVAAGESVAGAGV